MLVANQLRLPMQSLAIDQLNNLLEHYVDDDDIVQRREIVDWISGVMARKGQFVNSHEIAEIRGEIEAPIDTMFMYELLDFFADRLKVQQREAGVRHDLIDAVFALGGEDDLVRLLARVNALQAFIETDNGTNLLAGYKRAANILKKENHLVTLAQAGVQDGEAQNGKLDSRLRGNDEVLGTGDDPEMREADAAQAAQLSYTPEPAEKALIDALGNAEPQAAAAIAKEDFAAAMAALASLRAPIDAFFEEVTVNDDDPDKRTTRLGLLARFRAAVHNVADFSKIEG